MPDYARPESLASTQWMADHLTDPAVRIVKVLWAILPSLTVLPADKSKPYGIHGKEP